MLTQREAVSKSLLGGTKTIKRIAAETRLLEPSVRRVLGVGTKEGTFERVAPGVYVLTLKGRQTAYVMCADALEALPRMAAEGARKFDMVFLDIPYRTSGVTGGNRGVKFDTITPGEFAGKVLAPIMEMLRDEDSSVVYMHSNSAAGARQMAKYTEKLHMAGLKAVCRGTYSKTYRSGKPMSFGKYPMPPESVLVLNRSGRSVTGLPVTFDYRLVAPLHKGHYQTEKPRELLAGLIGAVTEEGDSVLDPFAGSGVCPAEAVRMGREAFAIEKNIEAVTNHIIPRVTAAV